YATTLHYAPCSADENGFRCVIVLPKGTNEDLPFKAADEGENRLLTAVNKWLIAHEEAGIDGAFCGLKGENVTVVSVGRFSPFRVGLKTPISVNLKSPMHHVCY